MAFTKNDPNINRTGLNRGSKKEKSYIEFFEEICGEIARENKMSVDGVRKIIYKVGYKKAKEGNYLFYKDAMDRIHGKATERIELTGRDGQPLEINLTEDQEKLRENILREHGLILELPKEEVKQSLALMVINNEQKPND